MTDPKDLVAVYQAGDPTEAYLVKNLLIDEGIEATVTEDHEQFHLPFSPSHVLVRRVDEERARAVVDAYDADQEARADRPDWTCPKCGATVVGTFDLCDACGTDRPGSEE